MTESGSSGFNRPLGEYIPGDWLAIPGMDVIMQQAWGEMAKKWLEGSIAYALIRQGRTVVYRPVVPPNETLLEVYAEPPFPHEAQAREAVAEIVTEWGARLAKLPEDVARHVDIFVPGIATSPPEQQG